MKEEPTRFADNNKQDTYNCAQYKLGIYKYAGSILEYIIRLFHLHNICWQNKKVHDEWLISRVTSLLHK